MKNTALFIIMFLSLGWMNPLTDTRIITGHVYSFESGDPIKGVTVKAKGTPVTTQTNVDGVYEIRIPDGATYLEFTMNGYQKKEIEIRSRGIIDVYLEASITLSLQPSPKDKRLGRLAPAAEKMEAAEYDMGFGQFSAAPDMNPVEFNTEEYSAINENIFHEALRVPLSTFSIDVDAASYSNIRRFINGSQLPPKDAVRIEEMINYFSYDYKEPEEEDPFSINAETAKCPWNEDHYLVHIGLQGKHIPLDDLPPSNLVFLLDVSGSMNQPNKLPLLKSAFKLLTANLRAEDRVAIVVYAGAAGVVLPSTAGNQKDAIIASLERLEAGGSTAGGQGIRLAYKIARQNFMPRGNNRIILATDGDFNVGESSNASMERLVEEERQSGVFLTVLGFGMGNYKDSKMEILADKGNGNYAYIDNILEAKKVLVNEFGGTLFTIAKDVKIQVEFNPATVKAYRLIGYENRKLRDEDFNNDKKDAGELGAGHTVTALYEIIPVGIEDPLPHSIDPLKYQKNNTVGTGRDKELMTVKLRFKKPDEDSSQLTSAIVSNKILSLMETSDNFRFSASVAAFGMVLRDSEFKGRADYPMILKLAGNARGKDVNGYRAEFINLVSAAEMISNI